MDFVLRIVFPLFVLSFAQLINVSNGKGDNRRPYSSIIKVTNGGKWGSWRTIEMCPPGTYATGFALKVENPQGWRDDTALNGIALRCTNSDTLGYSTVRSDEGSWGTGTQDIWCRRGGVLTSFQLLVEGPRGLGDDTAANNIRFNCSSGEILTGYGMSWGSWGVWSDSCVGKGICGIQTKVERPQRIGDDTALNDVQFYCCS